MESSVNFLGYSLAVNPFPLSITKGQKVVINTINQYSFCIAEKDVVFKEALRTSDILLPDGIGIVKACSYITGKPLKKIAGAEIHEDLLKTLNLEGGKCFYLGSSDKTLNGIKNRIKKDYPLVQAAFYSPPYKEIFDDKDIIAMIEQIDDFKPDVLFIGLTAPKQEKLSYLFKDKFDANIICSIGAVFDFYAKTITRPSQFWIDLHLEWLVRLVKEPKRMWKRYLYFGFLFIYKMLNQKKTIDQAPEEFAKQRLQ